MKKVLEFLRKNNVCTVATSAADKPRASVLEYYLAGDSILFATDEKSIKGQNLAKNNHISMSVYNMPQFVTIDDTTAKPTPSEIEEYNKQLFTHHPEFLEMIEKGMMHPFAYYKVMIDTAYFNDYSQGMTPTRVIKG